MIRRLNRETAPVDEVFFSYQGEGVFAGIPQIFIRFAGCNLKCDYCDTAVSSAENKKTKYYPRHFLFGLVSDIYIKNKSKFFGRSPSVSFTGGEPLLYGQYLAGLTEKFKKNKFSVYIETNGSLPEEMKKIYPYCDVVAMDIKFKSACNRDLFAAHKKFLNIAKNKVFVKTVITKLTSKREFIKAVKTVGSVSRKIKFVIQPSDNSKIVNEKIFEFYNFASQNLEDVRILPQLHKIWKIR